MKKTSFLTRACHIFLFLLALFFLERFCHKKTGGFQITKIVSDHPFNPAWATPPPTDAEREEIEWILDQPFTFYSYGGQAYVFLSADGSTVLKLFKHHHLRIPAWIKRLPLPKGLKRIRNKWIHRKEEKFILFFNSCKIAFDDFRERTGLIYLHLNKTDYLRQRISLIDKLGITHEIDLDQIDFALQKRVKLTKKHFRSLKNRNYSALAKSSIDSLLEMMVERNCKGIADRDPNLRRNCGFIQDRAYEIDLGSYTRSETLKIPFISKTDIYHKSLQLKRLIGKNYPDLSTYLEHRLEEIFYHSDLSEK